jgi:hypothetical protein
MYYQSLVDSSRFTVRRGAAESSSLKSEERGWGFGDLEEELEIMTVTTSESGIDVLVL